MNNSKSILNKSNTLFCNNITCNKTTSEKTSSKKISFDGRTNKNDIKNRIKRGKYNSDSRNYNKKNGRYYKYSNRLFKEYTSPKIQMPSNIQARVNKYNHSTRSKRSRSERLSVGQLNPSTFNYGCRFSSNYLPPNLSRERYAWRNDDRRGRGSCGGGLKKKELNYKYIIFNN